MERLIQQLERTQANEAGGSLARATFTQKMHVR